MFVQIDLEIVADQLQVPIWTPDSPRAHRMDVGTEVSASLENGVRQVRHNSQSASQVRQSIVILWFLL